MNNVKWIFFDVGSTLVDEHIAYEHIFCNIAKQTNKTYEEIFEEAEILYRQNKKGDLELEKKYNLQHIKWPIDKEILYTNVPDVLEKLKQNFYIGIIANQTLGTKERLEKWKILRYIDLVIASAEEGCSKPDLKIFEIALKRAGCKPNEAIMIGDRIDNDILPAKKIGMHTMWLKQGFGGYWSITCEHEKAELVVNNITEVYESLC